MASKDDGSREKNWRLYHLLDFFPPVSTLQVRFTAHKATLRTQYYHAYLTLSEVNRKHFYDIGGEQTYDFISSGTWGPMVPQFGVKGFSTCYFLYLLIELCLLSLFFVFLGLAVDEYASFDYFTVALPLLIAIVLLFIAPLVGCIVNWTSKEGGAFSSWNRVAPLGNAIAAGGYVVTAVLLFSTVISAEKRATAAGSYLFYFLGAAGGDVVYYLTSFIWRWTSSTTRLMKIDGNSPSPVISAGIFLMGWLHMLCGVAQWVLVGLKLDETIEWKWYYVFLPFAVRALLRWIEAMIRAALRHTQQVRGVLGVIFDILSSFLSNGFLIIALYWVAVRIEEGSSVLIMIVALIPVYAFLLYHIICLCITYIIILANVNELEEVEVRQTHLWLPKNEMVRYPALFNRNDVDMRDRSTAEGVCVEGEPYGNRDHSDVGSFPSHLEAYQEAPVHYDPAKLVPARGPSHEPFDDSSSENFSPEDDAEAMGNSESSSYEYVTETSEEASELRQKEAKWTATESLIELSESSDSDSGSYEYVEEGEYSYVTDNVTPLTR